jgi:hypothetical protein
VDGAVGDVEVRRRGLQQMRGDGEDLLAQGAVAAYITGQTISVDGGQWMLG